MNDEDGLGTGVPADAGQFPPHGSLDVKLGPGVEFDLIRKVAERLGSMARGLGNDCAVLDIPVGERLVVSTDTTVEGVHFHAAWLTPREVGYRAAMSAWSDLAAAGATPIGGLLALTVSDEWLPLVPAVAEGVGEAARIVRAPVVGGDTVAGPSLVITMSVLGTAARPLDRAGARPGDRVYLTGTIGGPLAAIRAWERGQAPEDTARLRFAHPQARLREARWLADRGVSAAVDVSDGLVGDLGHVAAASGVRLVIDLDRVPRWPGVSAIDAATSGEEYEIVCTAPVLIDCVAFAREFDLPLTQIGHVVDGPPGVEALVGGQRIGPITGYNHFS